ncbi:MAG TPA: LuxR C-terminal-related transcriptional regulator [Terriglobia bacterium]|nr:LuxR C-terminal-related transcriptional regulator [Terriglobia bacterium]
MDLLVQVIAAHPIAGQYLSSLLASDRKLANRLVPAVADFKQLPRSGQACLFVIDAFSLPLDLSALMRVLRVRHPGSKFLVLAYSDRGSDVEILRWLHRGIDGVVINDDDLRERLPEAALAIMDGALWAPPGILCEYERQIKLLLDLQVLPNTSLTGRETQILQLMLRRLSNKEIAGALGIRERTVRFHVFNIFHKLRVESRGGLQANLEKLSQATA